MYIALCIIVIVVLVIMLFLSHPKFGKHPSGERLHRIKNSPNYKNGSFHNISPTPSLTEGTSYFSVFKEFFFTKKPRLTPKDTIPSIKTDLHNTDIDKDILVWFGHSSYYIQIDGKRFLVDPVFCGYAAPVSFTAKAFKGTDIYTPDDIPTIDYLIITHDHWDHFDYDTVKQLKTKVGKVICGLGVGQHLELWGFESNRIIEKDWNEEIILDDGFIIHTASARHFSGRGLKRNQSLWMSYIVQTPTMRIFVGGDSGYDSHFAEIGEKFGSFDLAILENGQYDISWRYIHLLPDEFLQAAADLKAKRIFPVHNSKFAIANHSWDAPLSTITEINKGINIPLITPHIGEQVNLKDTSQQFAKWWETIT